MIKNHISEPELKQLINFLRIAIKPDLEFQAVYDKVMHYPSIQARIFEAFTNKTDSFITVFIKRKNRKIPLYFSQDIPQVIDSVTNSSTINTQAIDSAIDSNITQTQVVDSVTVSNITQTQAIDSEKLIKRKGRGKAKKKSPSRSLISVLVDDLYINKLDELATKNDTTFSHVVRAALLFYLQHKLR